MILNGFLDELNTIVYDDSVSEENRLLTLHESGNQLEEARSAWMTFGNNVSVTKKFGTTMLLCLKTCAKVEAG